MPADRITLVRFRLDTGDDGETFTLRFEQQIPRDRWEQHGIEATGEFLARSAREKFEEVRYPAFLVLPFTLGLMDHERPRMFEPGEIPPPQAYLDHVVCVLVERDAAQAAIALWPKPRWKALWNPKVALEQVKADAAS